ncbi:MAG: methyl-accepting chemotaxis protein [Lachnospiraceae bacterium]|nr:methyl-accepting chemotaxis protein [Lachnospiraceae bacterium]
MRKNSKNKEKNTEKKRLDGVSVFASLKTKIAMMIVFSVVLAAVTILAIVIPSVQGMLQNQTKNYIYDVAVSNGTMLETMRKAMRLNNPEALKSSFGEVGVEGVESSYAYVVAANGTMLFHPTAEKIGKPVENDVVKNVIAEIEEGKHPEPKVVEYDYKGVMKYAAYYVDEGNSSVLIVCADEDEILAPLNKVTRISIYAFLGVIIVITIIGLFLTELCIRPIVKVSKIVGKMAHMDFSENEGAEKLLKRRDETGLMSRSVARLRQEMIEMIEEIQGRSNELFGASERLDRDAAETAKTVAQVENAVGDIASGATSQAEETQNATENVIVMGNMIQETNEEAEALENNSEEMKKSSNHAMEILDELMQVNERTKTSIEEIYEQTNITNASAQKIKNATDLIASIAEETNLLSLNASIEAARAGEQGRGFAVVASQIQKLAEQSNESARQIDEITSALIQDSTKAVDTMQQVRDVMDEQSDKMQKTDEMFRQVKSGVENARERVVNITGKTENLDSSRGKVVDVVQNLSAIAEENAASSQETSASVAEVSNIVADISENATRLKEIAFGLEESVKKFKL